MFHPLNDTIKMTVTWPHDITMLPWCMDSFNHFPAELSWIMLSHAEWCWINLSHLVLTGNLRDVPGPGTWEVGWSELFSHPGDTCWPWVQYIFYPCLPLRLCEILYSPGFTGWRWSSGLGSDCFPKVYVEDMYLDFSRDFCGSSALQFFAHHSALLMTCRNSPFSRLSLFRCPVAAGLI